MIVANPGWNAIVSGDKFPIVAWACKETNVNAGSHTHTTVEVIALIVCGKEVVPAQTKEGFESILPPKNQYQNQ